MRQLALAAALIGALGVVVSGPCRAQAVFDGCPMNGDAKRGDVKDLDALKNQYNPPTAIDPRVTLQAVLAPGDDRDRWSERMGGTVEGYVAEVYVGGIETANCHARDALHRDSHIALALSPDTSERPQTMIVEVTPRWRAILAHATPPVDWQTSTLHETICHHWVRITGWLLFDAEHAGQSVNTATGPNVWRATAWEIHPIKAIELLDRPPGGPGGR